MPEGIEQYNWPKYVLLSLAVLCMSIGASLGSGKTKTQVFAAAILAQGTFTWGYFTKSTQV